jgi:hypothetical protein
MGIIGDHLIIRPDSAVQILYELSIAVHVGVVPTVFCEPARALLSGFMATEGRLGSVPG